METACSYLWWPKEPISCGSWWGALLYGGMDKPGLVKAWNSSRLKFQWVELFSWISNELNWCDHPMAALTPSPIFRKALGTLHYLVAEGRTGKVSHPPHDILARGPWFYSSPSRTCFHSLITETALSGLALCLSARFLLHRGWFPPGTLHAGHASLSWPHIPCSFYNYVSKEDGLIWWIH